MTERLEAHALTADNLGIAAVDDQITVNIECLVWLVDAGYPVDSVDELHSVKSSESETAHVVAKVQTLSKTVDHPESDVVADQTTMWVCDCWDYKANHAPDTRENEGPDDAGYCKHIQRVDRVARAANDERQTELVAE